MAVNFEWNVSDCEVYPSKSGKSNVVHKVHYELKGTDDTNVDSDGNNYCAVSKGRVYLDTSDLSSFINWSSLSASDVQGWVESAMGSSNVASVKSALESDISNQISPSSVHKILGS